MNVVFYRVSLLVVAAVFLMLPLPTASSWSLWMVAVCLIVLPASAFGWMKLGRH
jgi:hypothetical protein